MTRIHFQNRQRRIRLPRAWIVSSLRALLHAEGCGLGLSVVYVDNATLKDLNARFHAANRLTDVLAFPMAAWPPRRAKRGEPEKRRGATAADDAPLLGEVIVSADRAEQESRWRGLPLDRELTLYAVHGTLHLLGYDDHAAGERKGMRRREREALAAGRACTWPAPTSRRRSVLPPRRLS
ncbi:MAG: rRNA maturation RNase YbeY [Planctomycetes bacterium]|nr:rRNA maturation RNase YbeY [Planctomycetota bacterium]